jgi:hypothetical protein
MSELSIYELEAEHGEVLPERETLGVYNFYNYVIAFNQANALQAYTHYSHNSATAGQTIVFVG